jgi:hypothetical protein
VGALGARRLARVDDRGALRFDGCAVELDWWIGADDRWHRPDAEPAVRQARDGAAPSYETSMRVPGGDVRHRVWSIGGPCECVVVEVENDSPVPVALAIVLHRAPAHLPTDDSVVPLDRGTTLVLPRPPRGVVREADADALLGALEAGTRRGAHGGAEPRGDEPVAALLHPVAHRTRLRWVVALDARRRGPLDLTHVPDAATARAGWEPVLRRGLRVVPADPARSAEIDAARVDVLLEAGTPGADADVFGALEDWGFDTEAREVWRRLGWWARRRASRRAPPAPGTASARLRAARDAVIAERPDGVVRLVPAVLAPGAPLEVHDAPLRAATVSYAVRWHGDRPALLWDVRHAPRPVPLVAPGLDPSWSATTPSGEALLAPPAPPAPSPPSPATPGAPDPG